MRGRLATVVPTEVERDAAALHAAYAQDPSGGLWTYLPYGPFADAAAYRRWLGNAAAGADPMFHTILDPAGIPLGVGSFMRIDPDNAVMEIGHLAFGPRLQRTATATDAIALMMGRVFDELGYRRLEWKCNALNAASCRAARRLGFVYEGTFRKAAVVKGRNRDTAWFSITDEEWQAVRAALNTWLAPQNFDAAGRQRRSLEELRMA
jgi:RimJ/RimL family protein N-acetyltransferase